MKFTQSPEDALTAYRRVVPQHIIESAQMFAAMPAKDQAELLFYMTVSQANVIAIMASDMDLEIAQVDDTDKAN